MSNLSKLAAFGILVELFAILGLIYIAKTTLADPGKQITIAIFLVVSITLLVIAVKSLSFKDAILFAFYLSIGFVGVYEMLGFAFFPGLVKDAMLFSLENFCAMGIMMILVFCGYMGGIFLILAIKKLLKI
jgi:hypothetical protein